MPAYSSAVEKHMVALYESLSQKDRRRYAAVEAEKLGHGGPQYVADLFACYPRGVLVLAARLLAHIVVGVGRAAVLVVRPHVFIYPHHSNPVLRPRHPAERFPPGEPAGRGRYGRGLAGP